jgi:exonuclease SbcD
MGVQKQTGITNGYEAMIKLLHLADLHIGVENYGRIDPATGLHTRLNDYLARLDEALDVGLAEGVDLVLIAGDIYKNRTPNPTHQREFARRINRLRAAGTPVFILTGNHDISPSIGRAHSVEIFHALDVEGVTVADRPKVHLIETRAGPVQIIALPWITRQTLMTKEELRLASFGEIEAELRRRLDTFVEVSAAELDPAIPAVLAFHGTIDGAQVGAERNITLGQDLVLTRGAVAQPHIDYIALGHIHRHQCLGEHPPIVYPGSIERIDFGERDEDKGCVLVELEKGATRWRFHKLAARPFISIAVDVRNSSDPQERVANTIAKHELSAAVVRVEVKATREQAAVLREETIRTQLVEAHAFYIAAVVIEVEREVRGRYAEAERELMAGLTPRRTLEIYLQAKNTDPERMAALLAAADELIAETDSNGL